MKYQILINSNCKFLPLLFFSCLAEQLLALTGLLQVDLSFVVLLYVNPLRLVVNLIEEVEHEGWKLVEEELNWDWIRRETSILLHRWLPLAYFE